MSIEWKQHPLPLIENVQSKRVSRIFTVESMDLTFANGTKATYERIKGGRGAIMAVPFDGECFYLSSEFCAGTTRYELGFVKGKIDPGETEEDAANRELQEDIGFGARKITLLRRDLLVAPGMLELKMHFFLCEDLYRHKLEGDEPEIIDYIKVPVREAIELAFDMNSPLKESRSVAALVMALNRIGALRVGV